MRRPLSPDDEGGWVLLRDEPASVWPHVGQALLMVAGIGLFAVSIWAGVRVGLWLAEGR